MKPGPPLDGDFGSNHIRIIINCKTFGGTVGGGVFDVVAVAGEIGADLLAGIKPVDYAKETGAPHNYVAVPPVVLVLSSYRLWVVYVWFFFLMF